MRTISASGSLRPTCRATRPSGLLLPLNRAMKDTFKGGTRNVKLTKRRAPHALARHGRYFGTSALETLETVSNRMTRARRSLQASLIPIVMVALNTHGALAQTIPPVGDAAKKDDKPSATAVAQDAPKKDDKPAAAAQPAPAPAAPAAPAPGTITMSGLIDGYFQVNYQHPSSVGKPTFAAPFSGVNATRAFDYKDGFGLSLAEFNISRTPGRGFPLGITATLTAFDTPPVVYATEPGAKAGYEGIQQLYLTYTPHLLGRDVAIDFGKFVTPFGYEVIESVNNDNYSRGLLFTYGVPFYHTGVRFAAPLAKKLNFTGGIVNGWNNTTDDNDAKSFFTVFAWTPDSHFTGTLNYMGGAEGTGAYGRAVPTAGAGNITTNLFEFVPVYNVNSLLKIGGDIVYGAAAGDVNGAHVSGDWFGIAAYARYQWTPKIATALRVEQFEDMPGVGTLPGNSAGGLRFGAGYAKVRSFTATLEYAAFHNKLVSRLEYRHDRANQPFGRTGPD